MSVANTCVPITELDNFILKKVDALFSSSTAIDKLTEKVTALYTKRTRENNIQQDTLITKQKQLKKRMNNLYELIEEGSADQFDKERLKDVKKELLIINSKLSELDSSSMPSISQEQIKYYILKYRTDIKNGTAKSLRTLVHTFIDKITVSRDTITIRYKFGFSGAPGENRTHAFSSGGQRSIHWATGAHHWNRIYYNIPIDSCPIKSNFRKRKFINRIISVYFSGVFV